jgi:hypothetical protein
MKGHRRTQIGINCMVRLTWLERTSSLVLAGNTPHDIKVILQDDLCDAFQSGKTDYRGSLNKTVTILMKVWLTTPCDLIELRDAGLELLKRLPQQDCKAVHWGMAMAVYPFWGSVASQVGRLLRLQGSAVAPQVQLRMREQYGERERVARSTRYALRSFINWGVLQENGRKGIYKAGAIMAVRDTELIAWLIEADLHARATGSAPLMDLLDGPSLFPFRLKPINAENLMDVSTSLDIIRHGLGDELVMLRKQITHC